jgi:hypothetical protein
MTFADDGSDLTDELAAVIAALAENNPGHVVIFAQTIAKASRQTQLALLAGNHPEFARLLKASDRCP